jgi:hypothetical protein
VTSHSAKVSYVLREGQTRDHHCHWPGCDAQVPPAKWGCLKHWRLIPKELRDEIWACFRPGQEKTQSPSREYIAVALKVQRWIRQSYYGGL